ncbi:MAG: beta-xylosidase [Flammeovirgaceae bacterium]|nr:beta-xylosidase [Flammeovirgaceae bacterium]MBE60934.1 beta-xylosidase [Flammeovirgaceae bacterium]HCX24447.1 beta-xylosidase [Cytophagales bacterium]
MNITKTSLFSLLLAFVMLSCIKKEVPKVTYLFAYFTGNGEGEEQVRYAISKDGFKYFALNDDQPIIRSEDISRSGGVRDPHILRGEDGMFYMVLTDLHTTTMGWENPEMIMLKSPDLINWSHSIINIPETYPENFSEVNRVWAPQTIYDPAADKYMLYWSMRHNEDADIIYFAYANEDFTGLESEPKQLLFKSGACIDGDIVFKDGKYHLFFKNEDVDAKGIMLAISDKINEGYEVGEGFVDQSDDQVEGSGTFQLIGTDKYILMYDVYGAGKYQFCESTDLKNFKVIDDDIMMNFHPRHGSVLQITQKELDALLDKWGSLDYQAVLGAENDQVRKTNVVIEGNEIYLPVKVGTDLASLDPEFIVFPEASISKSGPQDFSNGAVEYEVTLNDKSKTYQVTASVDANPVLEGYYADPEIMYSERDQKYYLYPTSDGFNSWSGTYFETFSSPDLINWTPEGKILNLKSDVSWTNRNAWAPTAIERKVGDTYKYYYYFTAGQKVGVAVADDPQGPFVDSGKPLVDAKPKGITDGQEIDPDVFFDPQSGKYYLYWGNMYLAVAELNDDMVSIKQETLKVITPNDTFREGTEVIYRGGKYYFFWAVDDTRSPNYHVSYATADSPLGPLQIPEDNMVIEKDTVNAIYGTGHNSAIYSKENDQWYLVYHRFTRPKGMKMGRRAGFHRETCIDELNFNEDGSIIPVQPTLTGILKP